MHLETLHCDDISEFIADNNIDVTCPYCSLDGAECTVCDGSGQIMPIWNTIWNTGFHFIMGGSKVKRIPASNVVAFEHDDHIWFGLTGCGMDMTPYLALAWVNAFPGCSWMPDQFANQSNIESGYYEDLLGKKDAKRVYRARLSGCIAEYGILEQRISRLKKVIKKAGLKPRK